MEEWSVEVGREVCAVVVPIAQAYEPIFLEEGAEPSLPEKNIKILR